MDIFSHGLWTLAAGKGLNDFALKPKKKKPLKLRWLTWWGIFPDLFSFAVPFILIVPAFITGNLKPADWPSRTNIPTPESMNQAGANSAYWVFQLATVLYNLSHSFVIFAAVFLIIFLILKRPAWAMLGWPFHIFIDIFTHSYKFFPTPFLWPISGVKFNGLAWSQPWFLIADYSALVLVYLFLAKKNKKSSKI